MFWLITHTGVDRQFYGFANIVLFQILLDTTHLDGTTERSVNPLRDGGVEKRESERTNARCLNDAQRSLPASNAITMQLAALLPKTRLKRSIARKTGNATA